MMNGSHQMSIAWLLKHVRPGQTVLDAGSGSGYNAVHLAAAGCKVFAVDLFPEKGVVRKPDLAADLTSVPWKWAKDESFDVVVSTYCLMTLLGREAAAWAEIGRVLKVGGILLATGRHRMEMPYFEWDRGDPLRGDNRMTLVGLCSASGLELRDFQTVLYTPESYEPAPAETSNAWALRAVCTKGRRPK